MTNSRRPLSLSLVTRIKSHLEAEYIIRMTNYVLPSSESLGGSRRIEPDREAAPCRTPDALARPLFDRVATCRNGPRRRRPFWWGSAPAVVGAACRTAAPRPSDRQPQRPATKRSKTAISFLAAHVILDISVKLDSLVATEAGIWRMPF
ncbi:hypothetical protein CHELA40_13877 [Chelatococcus asaccharovorans]|nr:hypothetical protein CHELA40_13877 [Chelatococcus asaccharovorans]CAH1675017.1 hypothetical protein CHELA17_61751 [Chelatococcus asaccharovorans]